MFQEELDIIETIYENNSIYQGVVIYDSNKEHEARLLSMVLKSRDFPLVFYGDTFKWRTSQVKKDMNKYRLFFIPIKGVLRFLCIWQNNFINVNFMLFMDAHVKKIYYDVIAKINLPRADPMISLLV